MNYREACAQLGLDSDVELSDLTLKKSFKKAALTHHPDKNLDNPDQAKEIFQRISTAYEFLSECVARGQTGPNQPRFATSDDPLFEGMDEDRHYYYDDDDSEEFMRAEDLFNMFFGFSFGGGSVFFVPSHQHPKRHSPFANRTRFYQDDRYDEADDDDDIDDSFFRAMEEKMRRKKEERQKAKKREEEHQKYMAERAREAEAQGRDLFEAWNLKQLMGECKRRGIATRGMQQKDIIEALIQDEAKKRLREQLKEQAPLLDEWAEIIQMKKNAHWNGMKVRVIDFYADMNTYVVEWDMNASKKKTKGYFRESKTARIKPEHLRLWGTGEPIVDAAGMAGSNKENAQQEVPRKQNKKKKSKKEKKSAENVPKNEETKSSEEEAKEEETTKTETKATESPFKVTTDNDPDSNGKCCAICHKEHSHLQGENTTAIILSCAHLFCKDCCGGKYLPDASSEVEVRACRICHKRDPGIEGIKALPYVADLIDPPQALLEALYKEYSLIVACESIEALEKQQEKELKSLTFQKARELKDHKDACHNQADHGKMNKDKKGKLYKQAQASVEAKFGPKRQELLQHHKMQWRSVATAGNLKSLYGERDVAIEECTNAISRHYRRASIKVHPDRHGEKFQKEFDALTKARDSLSDVVLRREYLSQLLDVICTVGSFFLASSHTAWVQKHQPSEQNSNSKKPEAVLLIEGGMMHTKPRRPIVNILDANERRIRVTLRVPGSSNFEFHSYAKAIHIISKRAEDDSRKERRKTVVRDAFEFGEGGDIIEVNLTLPSVGLWDISWMFTIEVEPGCTRDSEVSTSNQLDLLPPKYKEKLKTCQTFENDAEVKAKKIHAVLRKLQKSGNILDVQVRYDELQEATIKARHLEYHLEKAMISVGANMEAENSPLENLRAALASASPLKLLLEKEMHLHQENEAKKEFRQKFYEILGNGDGGSWLRKVTKDDLQKENGSANRLYQLLMEGKKAWNLELVDAECLDVASNRSDLFSNKQLLSIAARRDTVEERAKQEALLLVTENEKTKSEQEALRALRAKAEMMDCERGALVQLIGLTSDPSLNGRLATYMGLGQKDRYILKLDDGTEIAVRKESFQPYRGGSVPHPPRKHDEWTCSMCTFIHEGYDVLALKSCSMCGTSRDVATDNAIAQDASGATTPSAHEQKAQPSEEESEVLISSGGARDSKPGPTTATKPAFVSLPLPNETVTQGIDLAPYVSSPPRKRNAQAKEDAVPAQKSLMKPSEPSITGRVSPTAENKDAKATRGSNKKCKFGAKCRFLLSGNCRFGHSDQDLAKATAKAAAKSKKDKLSDNGTMAVETAAPKVPEEEEEEGTSRMIEMTVMVDTRAIGFVIGPGGRMIKLFSRKSGAKIRAPSKQESKLACGESPIRIRGLSVAAVEKAASLIYKRLDKLKLVPEIAPVESSSSSARSEN